jgi:hypothetical protein
MTSTAQTASPVEIAEAAAARLRITETRPAAAAIAAGVKGAALTELARIFHVNNSRLRVEQIRQRIVDATAGAREDTAAISSDAWRRPADMAATPANVTRALRALWPDPAARIVTTVTDERVEIRCPRFDHTGVAEQLADLVSQVLKGRYQVADLRHSDTRGFRGTWVYLTAVTTPTDMPTEVPGQRTRTCREYGAGERVWAFTHGAWHPAIVRSQFLKVGVVVDVNGEREPLNGLDGSTFWLRASLADNAVAPRTAEHPAIEPAGRCTRCTGLVWLTDKGWLHSGDIGIDHCDHEVDGVVAVPPPWKVAQAKSRVTDAAPATLHNLIGWDVLTGDGWQTIREVHNRHGDNLVVTDETEPGREWGFSRRRVQVRAPHEAVALACGHLGVPGTGRDSDQGHGFCWFGCFKTLPVADPVAPVGADEWSSLGGQGGQVIRWGDRVAVVTAAGEIDHHARYPTEGRARAEYANRCGDPTAGTPRLGDRLLVGDDPTGPLLTVVSAELEPAADGSGSRFRVTVASRGAGGAEREIWNLEPGAFRFLERPVLAAWFRRNRGLVPATVPGELGAEPSPELAGGSGAPRRNRPSRAKNRRNDHAMVEYAIEEERPEPGSGRPTWAPVAAGVATLACPDAERQPHTPTQLCLDLALGGVAQTLPPSPRRRRLSGHIVGAPVHGYTALGPSRSLFQRTARVA